MITYYGDMGTNSGLTNVLSSIPAAKQRYLLVWEIMLDSYSDQVYYLVPVAGFVALAASPSFFHMALSHSSHSSLASIHRS